MIDVGVSGAFAPVISPDRQHIAFHADDGDSESSVYVSTVNGEDVRRLETADGPVRGYPHFWYSGGLYVGNGYVCTKIDVENSKAEVVEGVDECNISWSPDGSRASYQFEDEIWLMDSNGENKRVLVAPDDDSIFREPVWAP